MVAGPFFYSPFTIYYSPAFLALHHLIRVWRQVHRSFRVAFSQIADDVENRDRANQFALLDEWNISVTLVIHNGHDVTDRSLRRQGSNHRRHPVAYRRAKICVISDYLS